VATHLSNRVSQTLRENIQMLATLVLDICRVRHRYLSRSS